MKTIERAVVLSDLHLGVKESLFYAQDHPRMQATMNWLSDKLAALGEIDELIFLGDLFDLSLSPFDILYPDAKEFFESFSSLNNIKEIVYLPGNHDHHYWLEHVEQDQIVEKFKGGATPKESDFAHRIIDQRYPNEDPGTYFNDIGLKYFFPEAKRDKFVLSMKYPNHLRKINGQHYFFTHGHFLEDAFTPLQFLMDAVKLEDLETFNILWLEAVDYHLGHSGRLSDKVREIYHDCIINENKEKLNRCIKETLEHFRLKAHIGKFWIWVMKKVLNKLLKKQRGKAEATEQLFVSSMRFQGCSDKLLEKIRWYIEFIINRYDSTNPRFKNIPVPFTFVFGHTHDYFDAQITIAQNTYGIYNTGGWTVDKDGNRRDSGILIIDKNGCNWEKY